MKKRVELGQRYYFFTSFLELSSSLDQADEMDEQRYAVGNYFDTLAKAEFAIATIKNTIKAI